MSEGESLLKTIQEPDKIAVPPHDRASSSRRLDFVVSMLEHEHALFLRKEGNRDGFFNLWVCSPGETQGPAPRCDVAGIVAGRPEATEGRALSCTKCIISGLPAHVTSPAGPRAAGRRRTGSTVGMLLFWCFAPAGLVDYPARPCSTWRAHASEAIYNALFGRDGFMVVIPMQFRACPGIRFQAAAQAQ